MAAHSIRTLLKSGLFRFFPRQATEFFSARSRAYSHQLVEQWGCAALNQKLLAQFGNRVRRGPFAGLVLSPMTHKEHLAPYLLGLYEEELQPAWTRVMEGRYTQILDIGSKFGYYATGLARRFPDTTVVAFDTDPWAREATREMARANLVDNVQVEGFCDAAWLRKHLLPGAFVLSDCEGYESVLFGSGDIPALATCTLVVEIHDQLSPGASDVIARTFHATHEAVIIPSRPAVVRTEEEWAGLTASEREMAVNEFRTAQQNWQLLIPRASSSNRE
jgi:hypothetical protein